MATRQADVNTTLRSLDEALVRHARNKDVTALIPAYYAPEAKLLPPNAPVVTVCRTNRRIMNFPPECADFQRKWCGHHLAESAMSPPLSLRMSGLAASGPSRAGRCQGVVNLPRRHPGLWNTIFL